MEREARIAGYKFSVSANKSGVHVGVDKSPQNPEQRQEVFALFDQLRQAARQSGVTSPELLTYWVKNQLSRRNFVKK